MFFCIRSRGIGFSFGDVRYEEESYETSHDTKYDSSNAYAEDTNEDPNSLEMSHEDYGMSLEEQLRSGGGMGECLDHGVEKEIDGNNFNKLNFNRFFP